MTIHPVVTATSSAASTPMNAPSITRLLLHVVLGLLLLSAPPLAGIVVTVPTAVDISLVCVDCIQFVMVVGGHVGDMTKEHVYL